MIYKLKIVKIDSKYCDYLRKFDNKVAYNANEKETRPFVGVLFKINDFEYFAPLSSPKKKHLKMKNTIDFFKIDGGRLGAINFNNMIPVMKENYKLLNLEKKTESIKEERYRFLLKDQLEWLNKYYYQVKNKSLKLYMNYIDNNLPKNVFERCCNFSLLEAKCINYNSEEEKVYS